MTYTIVEEASEAIVEYTEDLDEAINDAKALRGKHLVVDEDDNILFDTMPGVSFKI